MFVRKNKRGKKGNEFQFFFTKRIFCYIFYEKYTFLLRKTRKNGFKDADNNK